MGSLPEVRSELKAIVGDDVQRLLDALELHDPIELIASVSSLATTMEAHGVRIYPDEETEEFSESPYQMATIEYLQSLALGRDFPKSTSPVTQEVAKNVLSLLLELRSALRWYYASEPRAKGEPAGRRLARIRTIDRTLFIRGEAYAVHLREILRRVHSCANPFLVREFGFETNDLVEVVDLLMEQVETRFNDTGKALTGFVRATLEYEAWCREQGIGEAESSEEDLERFFADRPVDAYVTEADREKLQEWSSLQEMVRLSPASLAQRHVAECLSLEFGGNAAFLSDKFGVGWPLNATLVHERPLIKHQGEYFSPDPRVVACYARSALDNLIKQRDSDYFRNSYANARHDATVALVAERLRRIFGDHAVFAHIFYTAPGAPFAGAPEIDLLMVFGGAIVAVEVKTGGYEAATRGGALKSLRDQLRDMVETGQKQVEALRQLLLDSDVSVRDAQGKDLLTLRKDSLRRWFSVVGTMEDVSAVSTQPIMLSDLGLKWEAPKSLVVSLPDLLVLTDLLDVPSDFLHYLHRRQAILGDWGVMSEDELDYLMFYIRKGLWFEDKKLGRESLIEIGVFTDELDDYYLAVDRGWDTEKPKREVPDELRQLLQGLECHPEGDAIEAIFCMLDCSGDARRLLAHNIQRQQRLTLMGKGARSITTVLGDRVLLVGSDSKPGSREIADSLAQGWWERFDAKEAIVVTWVPMLGFGSARAWRFTRT